MAAGNFLALEHFLGFDLRQRCLWRLPLQADLVAAFWAFKNNLAGFAHTFIVGSIGSVERAFFTPAVTCCDLVVHILCG